MTKAVTQEKPQKPYPGYPLTAHGSGQWAIKVAGKRHYMGVWADPEAALAKFEREFTYLQKGLKAPAETMRLSEMLNHWADSLAKALKRGQINERTRLDYIEIGKIVKHELGGSLPVDMITPHDLQKVNHALALKKTGEPASAVSHKRKLTTARMIFYYANETHDFHVKYKKALRSPEKRLIRQRKAATGVKMFEPAEIRALVTNADPIMKAVILLGINCAYGPSDCIELKLHHIRNGFADFPRPKTGIERRCPLWPETLKAIKAIADTERVLTGPRWNRHMLARSFRELAEGCGIYRKGITTLYTFRRTFETVAKNSGVNQSAIDRCMGHERPDMSETYSQRTFDKQLCKCTDFVYRWMKGRVKL